MKYSENKKDSSLTLKMTDKCHSERSEESFCRGCNDEILSLVNQFFNGRNLEKYDGRKGGGNELRHHI